MQALRSSGASAIKSVQSIPPTRGDTTSPVDLLQRGGQKETQYSADELPLKRLQKDLPSDKDSWQPLSEEDLQTHNRLTGSMPPYDMDNLSIGIPESKRGASCQSSVRSMESTTVPQRSSGSADNHRWGILNEVRISVCSGPLPEAIKPEIDNVLGLEISDKWRGELQCIAKHLCDGCVQVSSGDSHEDDCVEPIKRALLSMDSSKNFDFPMKIGIPFLYDVST